MNKDIKYAGYSSVPSDYECNDGDLGLSLGMVEEDGAIRPMQKPEVIMELEEGDTVKYIHKTPYYKHYIILNAGNLAWKEDGADKVQLHGFGNTRIHRVSGVGNTLVVLAEDGMHYLLWKDAEYVYLGTHIPECPLSFGLQGELIISDMFEVLFDKIGENKAYDEFSDENKTKISDQVLSKVNKFIQENSTDSGRFMFPFFVRYAYRLYDGSLTMHSAPILMIASSSVNPQVFYSMYSPGNGNAYLRVAGVSHKLDYAADIIGGENIAELQKWKDIVTSVDIFVSKPIYTYDQNGKCSSFRQVNDDDTYCVCYHTNQAPGLSLPEYEGRYPVKYQINRFSKLYAFGWEDLTYPNGRLMLPERSLDDVTKDIKECAQFYLIESVKVEQLTQTRKVIDVKEGYLKSLVTREVMSDDYDSHDMLVPKFAFPYNSRINIANIDKVLFVGHAASSLFNFSNGYVSSSGVGEITTADTQHVFVYIYIKQDGKTIVVKSDGGVYGLNAPILYLYYPNPNAYKAVIDRTVYGHKLYEVPLEKHAFLNGAFYFGGWEDISKPASEMPDGTNDIANRTVRIHNKIYTSDVNNPFNFPLLGINTVGAGETLGISSAAKALSEGQFGQFPLYAFTDEGVWALEVSSTGSYSARQPITRDVILKDTEPLQMDNAVFFATDRGIMLLSGSQTQCITDVVNSRENFDVSQLHGMEKLHAMLGHDADDTCFPIDSFSGFLYGCGMIYDYVHQRVIVYNPKYTYAYVYSLKSMLWGMVNSSIKAGINSYPEALAVGHNGELLNFSSMQGECGKGLIVTRPLKLGMPDILKTVDTVIQRGHFRKGHVQSVLYGSRDLYNWHLVWSSKDHCMRGFRGTPYKYFRIALLCSLSTDESIYGASLQFTPRLTNQPR